MHARRPLQQLQCLEDRRRRLRRFAGLAQEPQLTTGKDWRLFVMFLLAAVAITFGSLYFRTLAEPTMTPTLEAPAPSLPSAPPESKTGVVR